MLTKEQEGFGGEQDFPADARRGAERVHAPHRKCNAFGRQGSIMDDGEYGRNDLCLYLMDTEENE